MPVPHSRDANKTGAFNSRVQDQLQKLMTSAIITAVLLCERHEPSVMGTHGVGLEGKSLERECKDSCHVFGPYRKCRSCKATKNML